MSTIDADYIRKRPGMFIGDTDSAGLTHMIWELVANALDQHLVGRCRRIDVILEEDGSVVVADDGPGIPLVDASGRPFAEAALTQHHDTPTFDGHAPHEHVGAGRIGIGLFPLNALSSRLVLDVFREGSHHTQRFERGVAASRMEKVSPSTRTGTRVSLRPDPEIFADPRFDAATIAARLHELACLLPALTLTFEDRRAHLFHEPRGLIVLLEKTRRWAEPLDGTLVVDELVGEIRVEAAIEWRPCRESVVESYANVERTSDGGTHVEGLIGGLVEGLRDAQPIWTERPETQCVAAVTRGLHAVVCVRLQDPTYGAPTRSRLETLEAKAAVSFAVRSAFAPFLKRDGALLAHFAGGTSTTTT